MSIQFSCGSCGKQYNVANAMAGQRARCKGCGAQIAVPRAGATPAVPVAQAGGGPVIACPGCGRVLPDTATHCRACGFDFKAGPLYAKSEAGSSRRVQAWHLAAGGIVVALVLLSLTAAMLVRARHKVTGASQFGATKANHSVVVPQSSHPFFTARQAPIHLSPGIDFYPIVIGGDGAGLPMQVYLYLPSGRHEPRSLGCVFVAPAGSRGFHGMQLGKGDMAEHLPYVRAGFAVCAYELSGSVPEPTNGRLPWSVLVGPTREYMAVDGGLVNARYAMDYVLSQVPEVDPSRLFAAGHSSAGVVALDLAAADHRIKAVAAYAPATDMEARLAGGMAQLERYVPGAKDFIRRTSPMNHVNDFACPILLFHADDDANVPTSDNEGFAEALKAAGKRVEFVRVPAGGHYQSMIDQGVPDGIAFFISVGAGPTTRGGGWGG